MKLLLALLLAGASALASAQVSDAGEAPLTVGVNLVSVHAAKYQNYWVDGERQTFNNVNPGIYVIKGHWLAGIVYNSERSTSVYGGYAYAVNDWLDVVFGAVTGYRAFPVLPLLIPSVHYAITDKTSIRLNLIVSNVPALNLAFERKF